MKNNDKLRMRYKKLCLFRVSLWSCLGLIIFITQILRIVNEFVGLPIIFYTVSICVTLVLSIAVIILLVICYFKIRRIRKRIKPKDGAEKTDGENIVGENINGERIGGEENKDCDDETH